jgi:predicted lipoprotein with Yx(FWY)xxD motif
MNASNCMPHVDESTAPTRVRVVRVARALAAIGLAVGIAAAHAQTVAEKNGLLTDADGRTLYTFDKDAGGKSNCTGGCAAAWPPFFAQDPPKDNGAFTQIMREDGRMQWARDGKPLYFFAGDGRPGDAKGDGTGNVWHVVKTGGARASAANAYGSSYDANYYYR